MSTVLDGTAASSPAEASQPSYEDRVGSLTGPAREHWDMHGDIDGAEALMKPKETPISDDTADSSPASEEKPLETAPDSAPGEKPQPKDSERSRKRNEANDRRWEELIEERREMRRELEALRKQIAEGTAKPTPNEEKPADDRPKRPRMRDFQDPDAYEAAMDKYETDAEAYRLKQIEQKQNEYSTRESETQRVRTWSEQVVSAKKEMPDFEKVAFSPDVPASDVMIRAMQGHKVGAKIAYYMGQNRDVAARLANATHLPPDFKDLQKKDPVKAAYLVGKAEALVEAEFDRIADTLAKPPAAQKEKPQPRPKPTAEVAVEPRGSAVEDEEEDAIRRQDFEAYERIANKKALEGRR